MHDARRNSIESRIRSIVELGTTVYTDGLMRGLHGTCISVEPFHLARYIDERVFTRSTSATAPTTGASRPS